MYFASGRVPVQHWRARRGRRHGRHGRGGESRRFEALVRLGRPARAYRRMGGTGGRGRRVRPYRHGRCWRPGQGRHGQRRRHRVSGLRACLPGNAGGIGSHSRPGGAAPIGSCRRATIQASALARVLFNRTEVRKARYVLNDCGYFWEGMNSASARQPVVRDAPRIRSGRGADPRNEETAGGAIFERPRVLERHGGRWSLMVWPARAFVWRPILDSGRCTGKESGEWAGRGVGVFQHASVHSCASARFFGFEIGTWGRPELWNWPRRARRESVLQARYARKPKYPIWTSIGATCGLGCDGSQSMRSRTDPASDSRPGGKY